MSLLFLCPVTAQDIPATPGNIQYGRSCNDEKIWFWLSAPRRGEWLSTFIDAGMNGTPTHSVAWIGLGFMKSTRTIGQGCQLLVEPSFYITVPLTTGYVHKSLFVIPADPALKGLPLFAQAAHLGWQGFAMSRGIQMSVM